jgi:segregation and condensation protein B
LAVVLSETKTLKPSFRVKLNTLTQIKDSIHSLADKMGTSPLKFNLKPYIPIKDRERKKIKVKVYSNFLKEIVTDMGFTLVDELADFLVYPDYIRGKIPAEIEAAGDRAVEIPSHKNVPSDPLKRAHLRYNILEERLCTKL